MILQLLINSKVVEEQEIDPVKCGDPISLRDFVSVTSKWMLQNNSHRTGRWKLVLMAESQVWDFNNQLEKLLA